MSDYETKLAIRNLICKLNELDKTVNNIKANTQCYTISADSNVMNTYLPIAQITNNDVQVVATYTCRTKNNTVVYVYLDILIRDGYIINPSVTLFVSKEQNKLK